MNRRKLLGGVGAAGAALTAAGAAAQATPSHAAPALADALATYDARRAAYYAFHASTPEEDVETRRLYAVWLEAFDQVRDYPATTMADLLAKARVAKLELAVNADGSEDEPNGTGEDMCRRIVNELLRLGGEA